MADTADDGPIGSDGEESGDALIEDEASKDEASKDEVSKDEAGEEEAGEEETGEEEELEPLGQRLRALRHAQKLSLSEVARLSGVSKGYLSQVERSPTARPSAAILSDIARALGTSVAQLIEHQELEPLLPDDLDISDSLRAFSEEADLPPADIEMLAGIRYRGASPEAKEDWRFLYEAIRRSVGHTR